MFSTKFHSLILEKNANYLKNSVEFQINWGRLCENGGFSHIWKQGIWKFALREGRKENELKEQLNEKNELCVIR